VLILFTNCDKRKKHTIPLIVILLLHVFYFQQMERFRVVEKETKTKAYSKEGKFIIFKNLMLEPLERKRNLQKIF